MTRSRALLFFVWVFSFCVTGCAGMRPLPPPMAVIPGATGHFFPGQILDLKEGRSVSFEQLIDHLGRKDVIFVGEIHDNPEHHLLQTQILQALLACCTPLVVAMECFEGPRQEILDRYIRGEIGETEFLKQVDWKRGWGFDYAFYRPILLLARQHGIRVLAINAPREIVRKVARDGLKALTQSERADLPPDIDLSNQAHRAFLREVYRQPQHEDIGSFDFFYEAQCVWEDTMAHHVASQLREGNHKMVVFAGNGHLVRGFGIPERTIRRFPASTAIVLPYPLAGKVSLDREASDYVWLTADYSAKQEVS